MAFTLSVMQSCGLCCRRKQLKCIIVFNAKRGYHSTLLRKMRFNNGIVKVSNFFYRSKHNFVNKFLDEIENYGTTSSLDQSKFLKKVSVLMGCDDFQHFLENEKDVKQFKRWMPRLTYIVELKFLSNGVGRRARFS